MKNTIITISREHGSGGRLIAQKLALELGYLFYDRNIIEKAAQESGLSEEYLEQVETKASNSFLFNLSASLYASQSVSVSYDVPVSTKAFYAQTKAIEELTETGNCVVVGRCADYVLRDRPNLLRVFLYADLDSRIERAVKIYNEDSNHIAERIIKMDKGRANFYRHFTGETWGDVRSYDLAINTAVSGIDGAVELIKTLVNAQG